MKSIQVLCLRSLSFLNMFPGRIDMSSCSGSVHTTRQAMVVPSEMQAGKGRAESFAVDMHGQKL